MSASVDLEYPFRGRWQVRNSPANTVPSHGSTMFASSYAIDFAYIDAAQRTAPFGLRSLLRTEPPDRFPGYHRPILAPIDGVVIAVHDGEPDHSAYRGLASVCYALTQRRRVATGWASLAGNFVMIRRRGVIVALCHLARGSIIVRRGQDVQPGDDIGHCGNSGNSTEPHLHLQAFSDAPVEDARALPLTFQGHLPRNGNIVHA